MEFFSQERAKLRGTVLFLCVLLIGGTALAADKVVVIPLNSSGNSQDDHVAGKWDGRVNFRANALTGPTEILNVGGLILKASCSDKGGQDALSVNASTTENNSTIHINYIFGWGTTQEVQSVLDEDFDTGESLSFFNVGSSEYYDVQGTLVYSSPTGSNVTLIFQAHDDRPGSPPLGGTIGCLFAGTFFFSPAP